MVSAPRGACQRAGRALTLAGRCVTFNHPVNTPPHTLPPMPPRSSDLPAEVPGRRRPPEGARRLDPARTLSPGRAAGTPQR